MRPFLGIVGRLPKEARLSLEGFGEGVRGFGLLLLMMHLLRLQ
jgi:hypothetical protein